MKPTPAKIIHHSEGLGAPSADTVRQRAQELALINGRAEYTEDDWRDAKRELHGGHEPNDTNGEMEVELLISGRDMITSSLGHHVENMAMDDQENVAEELIAEGMDEAVHERMLAAVEDGESEDEEPG